MPPIGPLSATFCLVLELAVSKRDIWLEDRSVGRLQNTRGHVQPTAFDQWQGFYAAEVAAFSC